VKGAALTVVIPTRDRPDLLALTLRSVLGQTASDFDVIVVDDGERPETATLVTALGDSRVRLIRNPGPRGVSGARNGGVAAAQEGWVAFCDDDDLWAPNKLALQLSAAADNGAAWVYAGDVTVDEQLRLLSGSPPPTPDEVMRDLEHYNAVPAGASNVMVRTDALARAGPFDPALRTSEDWDLWLRLARSAGRPACVPRPLVALRAHARMTSRRTEWIFGDLDVIAHRHGIPVDRARHHRWAAWMALEDGRRGMAVRHYVEAVAAGDWRSAGRAVVVLLDRGIVQRRRVAADDPWAREAQSWLDRLEVPCGIKAGRR
jgi:glycosyltransferase involved in cell wall biosynthesis